MGNKISIKIYSHELAKELSLDVIGENIPITSISPLSKLSAYCLSFSSGSTALPNLEKSTVISSENENREHGSVIVSANPRLDFARALIWLEKCNGFEQCASEPKIHSTVKMGSNVFMDKGVVIGSNTIIGNNVVIGKRVRIGENCVIKSGAVIGEDGFGFVRDEKKLPIRFIHLGSVVIGSNVEVGSLSTICRGALEDTVIEDHVKIDDHVHVGHNVIVRKASILTSSAVIGGGCEIQPFAWIGLNASLIQKIHIGENSIVGLGSAVFRSVEANSKVVGNPTKRSVEIIE